MFVSAFAKPTITPKKLVTNYTNPSATKIVIVSRRLSKTSAILPYLIVNSSVKD